jgi:hypothetical protein
MAKLVQCKENLNFTCLISFSHLCLGLSSSFHCLVMAHSIPSSAEVKNPVDECCQAVIFLLMYPQLRADCKGAHVRTHTHTHTHTYPNMILSKRSHTCLKFLSVIALTRPPLWSSGQSFWLQIQRSGFDSWHYQLF